MTVRPIMCRAAVLLVAGSVLAPVPFTAASAADGGSRGINWSYVNACSRKAPGAPRVECIDVELKRQDARLNAAYRVALKEQGPELRDVQRAWLAWVELQCEFGAYAVGIAVMESVNRCRLEETARQADWLENL